MNQVIAWVLLSKSYLYVYFNAYIHAMHHLAEYLNKVPMRKILKEDELINRRVMFTCIVFLEN